jgi:3-dehydroquinate dehydratase I
MSSATQLVPSDLKALKDERGNLDIRIPVVVYQEGCDDIVISVADVLGKPHRLVRSLAEIDTPSKDTVVGILLEDARKLTEGSRTELEQRDSTTFVVINTHCVESGEAPDESLSRQCDYEFLYSQKLFVRKDLARFLSFTLGQINHHARLIRKPRTCFIALTFSDIRAGLSNIDILTVGADAVELRVDLLKEKLPDGSESDLPSLKYVGEQLMYLRQRTDLPIIFTTRCKDEGGMFPKDDPALFQLYLSRAIQWGCDYIDVEQWLPDEIRKHIWDHKANSRIISSWHDFSGTFKWSSGQPQKVFERGQQYSDIVKMIATVHDIADNYELEYFRSTVALSTHPFIAVNTGQNGQISRVLNRVFSPITHPLLPTIAAPGQLSCAEVNNAMFVMGTLPKQEMYAIGTFHSAPHTMFFEKCFNELGLPHRFVSMPRGWGSTEPIEPITLSPAFGGAYFFPPLLGPQPYLHGLTDEAKSIGNIDLIRVERDGGERKLIGDNKGWKAIRDVLVRDFMPSAYKSRQALVLASSADGGMSSMFALRSLNVSTIYTVGFKARGELAAGTDHFTSLAAMNRVEQPLVIISTLPPESSHLVQPLLRHFNKNPNGDSSSQAKEKVFIDISNGGRKGNNAAVAEAFGWKAYGIAEISAWTTVETLLAVVDANVPVDFIRMAGGKGLYFDDAQLYEETYF